MQLKNREIVQAIQALKAIPTLKKSPKGTYALARNLAVLTEALRPIEDSARALFKEHFGSESATVDAKHERMQEYQLAVRKLDDTVTELNLHKFSFDDLNLVENEINHEHLSAIRFLLEGWDVP